MTFMSSRSHLIVKLLLIMLFVFTFSKGLVNVFSNPPWQAADEVMFLEAAKVTGNAFPKIVFSDENPDSSLQSAILRCMQNHCFFERLQIPAHYPLTETFRNTVFIRDAPSKLGREPLFYLLTGLPIRFFTSGLLEALYLSRLICFLFALAGVSLLILTVKNSFNNDYHTLFLAVSLTVLHPAFWHLASSMTAEAWKFFLVCLGLFLVTHPKMHSFNLYSASILSAWIAIVAASRWTLLPLALTITVISVLTHLKKKSSKSRLHFLSLSLIFCIPILTVPLLMKHQLLLHELNHATSGIIRLVTGQADFCVIISTLTSTFWTGFGWLNIPVSNFTELFSGFITLLWCLLFLVYALRGFSGKFRKSEPLWFLIVIPPVIMLVLVFIRALSLQPSIQGRYLFPVLPFITLGISRSVLTLHRIRSALIICLLCSAAILDVSANLSGWINYQHTTYKSVKNPVKALSQLSWSNQNGIVCVLEPGHKYSSSFLSKGWYPAKPGATQQWMLNRAEILLPLLGHIDTILYLELIQYCAGMDVSRNMDIFFNGHLLDSIFLSSSEVKVKLSIPAELIKMGLNRLTFETNQAISPFDQNESDDHRYLSTGLKRVSLLCGTFSPETFNKTEKASGWYITSNSTSMLYIDSENSLICHGINEGDHILLEQSDGNYQRLWWNNPAAISLSKTRSVQNMKYLESTSNHFVNKFQNFRDSISHLPWFLSDVYFHLFLLILWLFLTAIFTVSVILFITARSTRNPISSA
ncbi:hypothetical protein K8T06_01695 [bacterium]|nr:hypothetical protein [bacterium]